MECRRYQVVTFVGHSSSIDSGHDKFNDAKDRMFEIEETMNTAAVVCDMSNNGKIVAQNAFY